MISSKITRALLSSKSSKKKSSVNKDTEPEVCVEELPEKCTSVEREDFSDDNDSDAEENAETTGFGKSLVKNKDSKVKDKKFKKLFHSGFKVVHVANEDTESKDTYVKFTDPMLINWVRCALTNPMDGTMSCQTNFYEAKPKMTLEELITFIPDFERYSQTGTPASNQKGFVEFLQSEAKHLVKLIEKLLLEDKICYNGLWYLFSRDTEFFSWVLGGSVVVGSKVDTIRYLSSAFVSGFQIKGQVVDAILSNDPNSGTAGGSESNVKVDYREQTFMIPEFEGAVKISDLPVQPMCADKTMKEFLEKRGRKYLHAVTGIKAEELVQTKMKKAARKPVAQYLQFTGPVIIPGAMGHSVVKGDGRVMVDPSTYFHMHGLAQFSGKGFGGAQAVRQQAQNRVRQSKTEKHRIFKDLWCAWPAVLGFSFACKTWGYLPVDGLNEIKFDDQAFDRLVLDQDKKDLIEAVVNSHVGRLKTMKNNKEESESTKSRYNFKDVIAEKGVGQIFLLHGNPGVGKTLTAEAISEVMHLPLYSISVGELGTTPEKLETSLGFILEIAARWEAVILIDEADIFLERRGKDDVQRNALVGIFLRLLEYHQGVLFLTTNRVGCFDPAFHSRITATILYHDLDCSSRMKIWKNFLNDRFEDSTYQAFAEKSGHLNGRQIRNCVKVAYALAEERDKKRAKNNDTPLLNNNGGDPLDEEIIMKALSLVAQFDDDLRRWQEDEGKGKGLLKFDD